MELRDLFCLGVDFCVEPVIADYERVLAFLFWYARTVSKIKIKLPARLLLNPTANSDTKLASFTSTLAL